ncbi:MAG: hypothetical protein KKA81_13420 [Bacteroidetes bacterium]|nr:hypothetical protein [Bacteroidota bacterium]
MISKWHTVIFLIIFSNALFAQNEPVRIELTTVNHSLKPGAIQTLVFKVFNNTNDTIEARPRVLLPDGWRMVLGNQPLTIAGKGIRVHLINFQVPVQAPAEIYPFSFILSDIFSGNDIASFTCNFEIMESIQFEFQLAESPAYIIAGEDIHTSMMLRNTGNKIQTISLSPSNCFVKGSNNITLAPGESSIVRVETPTNADQAFESRVSFSVRAFIPGSFEKHLFHYVKLIPSRQAKTDIYERFPVKFASRYMGRGQNGEYTYGYQAEVFGKGFIDHNDKHQLEFLARGPNQYGATAMGMYDEYFIAYSNPHAYVFVGDKGFGLTQLTEFARYGRGVEASATYGNFKIGTYQMKPRYFGEIKHEMAAYGKYRFLEKNETGIHYVMKTVPESKEKVHLASITTNLQIVKNTLLEAEIATGNHGNKKGMGYRVFMQSSINRLNISAFFLYSNKNFPGFYQNARFYNGTINYNFSRRLSAGVSFRQDFKNAQLDTLFGTAPFTQSYQARTSIMLAKKMFLRLAAGRTTKEDRMPLHKFHYTHDFLKINYSHNLEKLGYTLSWEYGKVDNLLEKSGITEKNTMKGSGKFSYQPSPMQSFDVFASWSNMESFLFGQRQDWTFGLSARKQFTKNLTTSIQYQNNFSQEEYYRNRNLFEVNVNYRFFRDHNITAICSYTLQEKKLSNPDYSFSLSYSCNINVPIRKTGDIGSLRGNIANLGVKTTEGIILYLNGQATSTDEYGNFTFNNVPKGEYFLLLDKSSIEMRDIPNVNFPLPVEILADQETVLAFGITRAVVVKGRLNLEIQESKVKLLEEKETKPVQLILEIRNGEESIKILNETDGSFTFPFLRPGDWTLKIYRNGLGPEYIIEKTEFSLDLQPGDNRQIEINIRKKERKLIMKNNNIQISTKKKN